MSWSNVSPPKAPRAELARVLEVLERLGREPDSRSASAVLRIWDEQGSWREPFTWYTGAFFMLAAISIGLAMGYGQGSLGQGYGLGFILLSIVPLPILIWIQVNRHKVAAQDAATIGHAASSALIAISRHKSLRHREVTKEDIKFARSKIRQCGEAYRDALIEIIHAAEPEKNEPLPDL